MSSLVSRVRHLGDQILGRGEAAVTLPPMDGALLPNNRIEEIEALCEIAAPDNLIERDGKALFSSGNELIEIDPQRGDIQPVATFGASITALAMMPDGRIAVALESGVIQLHGDEGEASLGDLGDYRCFCPTALVANADGSLIVAEGSTRHRASQWKRDLMTHGRSGSVWHLDPATGRAQRLAGGLAFPMGLARHGDDGLVVAEAWRHRLCRLNGNGNGQTPPQVLISDLPGYPGKLTPSADGGHWLALFAPRSQLVEFVLREKRYRERMLREIPEPFWVAPSLESGKDFRELLQGGAIKSMGILKPWAPTRSYGLLVHLDADWQPTTSLHSRADGKRHGITSALELGNDILITSKGGHRILRAPSWSAEEAQ